MNADGEREHDESGPEQAPAGAGRVPPARDPAFAARYLARDGLHLGATPMPVPADLSTMPAGSDMAVTLAGLDPARMHRGQLAQLIEAQLRQAAWGFAGLLETLWEWARSPVADGGTVVRTDEPHKYAGKELAPLANWTGYRAESMLTLARLAVHVAPALLVALREGRLDEHRLHVIATELASIRDEELIRHIVDVVLGDVQHHTSRTLTEHIRRTVAGLDPDAVRADRQHRLAKRRLVRRELPGGLAKLSLGTQDAAKVAAAFEHVRAIAQATHAVGDTRGRTMEQLAADIAVDLLSGVDPAHAGYAQPADGRGRINLTLGLSTLAGRDDDPGLLAGHGPVTAAVARRVAAEFADVCQWRFQLYADGGKLISEGPLPRSAVAELVAGLRRWAGRDDRHPVDASAGDDGRAHRDPTAAQKDYVRARDKHCQFPGCRVPARRCDIDHVVAWIDGGQTVVSNLRCVCRGHHRFKHVYGLSYREGIGGIDWDLPGRRYLKRHQRPPGVTGPPWPPVIVDATKYRHRNGHSGGPPVHLRH